MLLADPTTATTRDEPEGRSAFRFFTAVFVPLAALYLATATWRPPYDADTLTNALTAQEIGRDGDVFLENHVQLTAAEFQGVVSWVVPATEGAASQYPPGAALLAAPLYAVWPGDGFVRTTTHSGVTVSYQVPEIAPAAISAALAVAAGVAMIGLALRRLGGDRDAALAALALGLATGVWSVAADKLWLHSADVLYLGLGLWMAARFYLLSGLGFGLALITRPHTVLIAAGTGLGRSLDVRSWRPAVIIGSGTLAGLVALLLFNGAVFGAASISGGYDVAAGSYVTDGVLTFARNLWGAGFDLTRGLFPYSPFLLVLLGGVAKAWRAAPQWVRGAALGGLAYLLVQLASNRFSGGSGFWGYRYPIEALVAAAPLLFLAYREWVSKRPVAQRLFVVALAASVGIHAAGALRCARYLC